MDETGRRSKYLWRKEHQGTQRPEYYKHHPVDTESLKNSDTSHVGESDSELGAKISKPGEQPRDQKMTTLVVCTLVGDIS